MNLSISKYKLLTGEISAIFFGEYSLNSDFHNKQILQEAAHA